MTRSDPDPSHPSPDPPWPETLATVTACTYQFGSLATMAFGIPDRNHFLIAFTYPAAGQTYTGQLRSPTASPQGETFPLTYNPLDPRQTSKSTSWP